MKISQKLKLNSLVVLILITLNTGAGTILVLRMMDDMRQLAEVEEPLEEAVLEMEINVGEAARAVLNYLRNNEENHIERMYDSERDFDRHARKFERLAETEKERELGRQVMNRYQKFRLLGEDIISLSARRNTDLSMFRKDVNEIDELIGEKLQTAIDYAASDAIAKIEAALSMEINIDEAFAAIEGYILKFDPTLPPKIKDAEADFRHYLA